MAGTTFRVPRSRGMFSGVLLLLLGLWGGFALFVGPYFDFGFSPDKAWHYTGDRLWLSILPAAGTVLGGLIVLASAHRAVAMFGAWLAALSGAWFVVGGPVSVFWDAAGVGSPLGAEEGRRVAEQLSMYTALGVLIVFFAALALGRFAVVGVRETRLAEEPGGRSGSVGREGGDRYARQRPGEPEDRPWEQAPQQGGQGAGTTQPLSPRYGRTTNPGPEQDEPWRNDPSWTRERPRDESSWSEPPRQAAAQASGPKAEAGPPVQARPAERDGTTGTAGRPTAAAQTTTPDDQRVAGGSAASQRPR